MHHLFRATQCRRRWKNFQDAELKKTGVWSPKVLAYASDSVTSVTHSCAMLMLVANSAAAGSAAVPASKLSAVTGNNSRLEHLLLML